jgi:hypothetical protein
VTLEIRPVRSALARRRFVDLPFRLFRSDPTWVPPLRLSVLDRLSPKHPANEHQETALWMAYRDGRAVGRIGACRDSMFDEFQDLRWAWVGFFECDDDPAAAGALFEAAWDWGRHRGATEAVGPGSFTTNDEVGLLVDGFQHRPLVLTTQNPPYYERLWTAAGWEPAMDLWGWRFTRSRTAMSERQMAVLERIRQRSDFTVRPLRMDDWDAEVSRFFDLYNSAWARNWGFAPMTEAEVSHLAKDLKRIIDPNITLLVEDGAGDTVAVALVLPDANLPMRRVRSGRILPTGWFHLLRGLPRTDAVRVFALGVRPDKQTLALGPLLYSEVIGTLDAITRIRFAEASWILGVNDRMNGALAALGGERHKTWRMYRRAL